MVEASIPQLRAATAEVAIIQQRSPLMIGLYLKEVSGILKSKVENVLRFVFERIFFGDLEREHRIVEIESAREEVLQKRIETLAKAFDLVEKTGDPTLHDDFIEGLKSAIRPFQEDHPRIT